MAQGAVDSVLFGGQFSNFGLFRALLVFGNSGKQTNYVRILGHLV